MTVATNAEGAGLTTQHPLANDDERLQESLRRIEPRREGRAAAWIRLSGLGEQSRRQPNLRVATEYISEMATRLDAEIFTLSCGDMVLLATEKQLGRLDAVIARLRDLFSEDPLVNASQYNPDIEGDPFCCWYRLQQQFAELNARLRSVLASDLRPVQARRSIRPGELGRLEDVLGKADLTAFMQTQPVCSIARTGLLAAQFHEMWISIGDLERKLMPEINLQQDLWLFHHLTRTLDRRMLVLAGREVKAGRESFSVNMNIDTLLSPEFRAFDKKIPVALRGKITIELQKSEIFFDIGAYRFVRDMLKDFGYNICLDGMTHLTLPMLDVAALGVDYVKLIWSPELYSDNPRDLRLLKDLVLRIGKGSLILSRCDNEGAVMTGMNAGIELFQGFHITEKLHNRSRMG